MSYDIAVLLDYVAKNTRVASVRAAMEETREALSKTEVEVLLDDFTVRGHRYRGSTQETTAVRASKVAGLKLAHVMEGTDPLPKKPSTFAEFSERFLTWMTDARLESQTKRYYRNGWRMLKTTAVVR